MGNNSNATTQKKVPGNNITNDWNGAWQCKNQLLIQITYIKVLQYVITLVKSFSYVKCRPTNSQTDQKTDCCTALSVVRCGGDDGTTDADGVKKAVRMICCCTSTTYLLFACTTFLHTNALFPFNGDVSSSFFIYSFSFIRFVFYSFFISHR